MLPIERPHVCLMVYSNRYHIRQLQSSTLIMGTIVTQCDKNGICQTHVQL